MADAEFPGALAAASFRSPLIERLLRWDRYDRESFSALVSKLQIGHNHQRDLMDWLEEIALRDTVAIAAVLSSEGVAKIESDPRLGRSDKLKRIKEHVRRLRFPRLTESEDAVRSRLRDLKVGPVVHITVPPGLEGGKLRVEFSAATVAEFKNCIQKLGDAAESHSLEDAFAILAGKLPDGIWEHRRQKDRS